MVQISTISILIAASIGPKFTVTAFKATPIWAYLEPLGLKAAAIISFDTLLFPWVILTGVGILIDDIQAHLDLDKLFYHVILYLLLARRRINILFLLFLNL